MPSKNPPKTAPPILPMPPITAAIKHLSPGITPISGLSCGYLYDHITPPKAAKSEPRPKVNEMILFTSTPMSRAVSISVETARMAIPVFVPLTIQSRRISSAAVTMGIRRLTLKKDTEPTLSTFPIISGTSTPFGLPPKISTARFSSRNEAPMALIMIEIRGESRKGA